MNQAFFEKRRQGEGKSSDCLYEIASGRNCSKCYSSKTQRCGLTRRTQRPSSWKKSIIYPVSAQSWVRQQVISQTGQTKQARDRQAELQTSCGLARKGWYCMQGRQRGTGNRWLGGAGTHWGQQQDRWGKQRVSEMTVEANDSKCKCKKKSKKMYKINKHK